MLHSTCMRFSRQDISTIWTPSRRRLIFLSAAAAFAFLTNLAAIVPAQAQSTLFSDTFSSATPMGSSPGPGSDVVASSVDTTTIGSYAFDYSRLTKHNVQNDGQQTQNTPSYPPTTVAAGPSLEIVPYTSSGTDAQATMPAQSNSYFSLTLNAAPGKFINLSSFLVDVATGGLTGGYITPTNPDGTPVSTNPDGTPATTPSYLRGFDIRSSLDGYTMPLIADYHDYNPMTGVTTGGLTNTFHTYSADVSGNPAYQFLTSVTFHFYVYTPASSAGLRSVDFQNLQFLGSSSDQPEPGALALALPGVGLFAVTLRQRRRKA